MTHRHQPPSRRRYAAEHPTVAVHCDTETHQRLKMLRDESGLPLGQLVKQALGLLEKDLRGAHAKGRAQGLQEGREQGYRKGFAAAQARYRLTYPCYVCGQAIEVGAGSDAARVAADALRDQGWGHHACHERVVVKVRRTER